MLHLKFACIFLLFSLIFSNNAVKIGISKPSEQNVTSTTPESTTSTTIAPKTTPTTTTIKTTTVITTTATPSTTKSTKTTTYPSTTRTEPSTTSTTTTKKPTPKKEPKTDPINPEKTGAMRRQATPNYYCNCDLSQGFCETNCCCDIDCSNDELKTFTCHEEHHTLFDFHYQQGLPYCHVNDGWLCVIKENTRNLPAEIFNRNKLKQKKYSAWPSPFAGSQTATKQDREFYKSGDAILIYDEQTEDIGSFDIPYPMITSKCKIKEPIRYLIHEQHECETTLEKAQEFVKTFYQTMYISRILKRKKSTINKAMIMEHCIGEKECTNFHTEICTPVGNSGDKKIFNCQQVMNGTLEDLSENEFCEKIQINVNHNYTNLFGIDVRFYMAEIDFSSSWEEYCVGQKFEINFVHENESLADATSGNLGYLTGKPIIRGRYVFINDSVEENERRLILDYFHNNRTKYSRQLNKIRIPGSVDGLCSVNRSEAINFGESSFTKCSVALGNETEIEINSNFTQICQKLQVSIFEALLMDNRNLSFGKGFDIYVSEYGAPVNHSNAWSRVNVKNLEEIAIKGFHNADSETFTCENMVIDLEISFLSARLTVNGVEHQNLIKEATLKFGPHLDLQFQIDEAVKVPIFLNVMFYDLTDLQRSKSESSVNRFSLNLVFVAIFSIKVCDIFRQ